VKWRVDRKGPPIGVDVGRRTVKAVQLRRAGAGWRLCAAAVVPRAAEAARLQGEEAAALRDALAGEGFVGRELVLAAPADCVMTGIMELPPRESGAPVEQLARRELARLHRCEADEIEVACWDLPRPARAANVTFVMGVACRHDEANALLDAVEAAGLHVRALEVHASAAARACLPLLATAGGIVGILDVGWSAAHLLLWHQGVVVYERKLTKGGQAALTAALAAGMGVTEQEAQRLLFAAPGAAAPRRRRGRKAKALADCLQAHVVALAEEMQVPLTYLGNQYPDAQVEKLLLIGGGAAVPSLAQQLGAALEVAAQVVAPTDLADCDDAGVELGPAMTVAVGLAQRA